MVKKDMAEIHGVLDEEANTYRLYIGNIIVVSINKTQRTVEVADVWCEIMGYKLLVGSSFGQCKPYKKGDTT